MGKQEEKVFFTDGGKQRLLLPAARCNSLDFPLSPPVLGITPYVFMLGSFV